MGSKSSIWIRLDFMRRKQLYKYHICIKVEKILKGSLVLIPSPSVTEGEGDGIKSRLPFKIFSTLTVSISIQNDTTCLKSFIIQKTFEIPMYQTKLSQFHYRYCTKL